jgi:hypothetical protein
MSMRQQGTTIDTSKIKEHMPVVASDGSKFATVDHMDGSLIRLTKDEQDQHHWIPTEWVDKVDDKVHLNRDSNQAKREWATSPMATNS